MKSQRMAVALFVGGSGLIFLVMFLMQPLPFGSVPRDKMVLMLSRAIFLPGILASMAWVESLTLTDRRGYATLGDFCLWIWFCLSTDKLPLAAQLPLGLVVWLRICLSDWAAANTSVLKPPDD